MNQLDWAEVLLMATGQPTRVTTLRGASRKFKIRLDTLRYWAHNGRIKVILWPAARGQAMVLDEDSVARVVKLHRLNPHPGGRPRKTLISLPQTP